MLPTGAPKPTRLRSSGLPNLSQSWSMFAAPPKSFPDSLPHTILTSGPPMAWSEYIGGQREGIIGGALFENLAKR